MTLRLGTAHDIGLALATTSAMLVVLLGGAFPSWAWLALGAPWVGALLSSMRQAAVPPQTSPALIARGQEHMSSAGVGWHCQMAALLRRHCQPAGQQE